jgi:purine-nucleoside phosphorylase
MLDRRTPTEKILSHDAAAIEAAAGGKIDVAIVLGTGLSAAITPAFTYSAIPYDRLLGMPVSSLQGHAGEALVGTWQGCRVVAFAGRVHLYQGFSPQQITVDVRLAHAAGAKTIVLTNAAGAIDPAMQTGDLMLIADHLNLTGRNPLIGIPLPDPFVDMSQAYSSRLRDLAKRFAKPEQRMREGVYAGVLGPSLETPAEVRYLRALGAQAVGMSTVLETIYARSLGLDVMGISVITNAAGTNTSLDAVIAASSEAGGRLGDLFDRLLPAI